MTMFENWCTLNGVQPVPAAPKDVAKFISDIAELGMTKIWPAVCEVSRAHYVIGLADPTMSAPVSVAIASIAPIDAPRWSKEHQQAFKRLPYDLQQFLAQEDKRQQAVIHSAMNVAAEARREAGLPKLPKNFYRNEGRKSDGNQSHAS